MSQFPEETTARSFRNLYRRPGFPKDTISVTFLDGISQYELFSRDAPAKAYRNYGHFSDEDGAQILAANAHNQIWHRLQGDESEYVEWLLGGTDFDTATARASRTQRWQLFEVQTTAYTRWSINAAAGRYTDTPSTTKVAATPLPSVTVPPPTKSGRLVARGLLPVARSEATFDRMNFCLGARDLAALEQMEQAGLIAFLEPGTPVRIVESRGFVIRTKQRVQIVGTMAEVWVSPSEIADESDVSVPKAQAVIHDEKRATRRASSSPTPKVSPTRSP